MKTKIFTFFLALVASVGTLFAESGTCGENLTWDLTDGVLTISGTGAMKNYGYIYGTVIDAPWMNNWEQITQVVVSNGVTSIGKSAFSGCSGLTSVAIGNSVTSIGSEAFADCTGLTSVIIPNSVTSIGNNAFEFIPNVIYNGTASGSPWGAKSANGYVDGWFVYSDNTKTNLLACSYAATGEISIPNSVTSIGESAFSGCSDLTSIDIPNSVTSIGDYAFYGGSGLTSITIPNSVTSIGNSAFYNVFNIIYNGTATGSPWGARSVNGYIDGWLVYSDNTKTNLVTCSSAATGIIDIPNSVTSIGESAFSGCSDLTSIDIPNSVTSIGKWAFIDCSGLTSITIPNSVTSIGDYAFYGCSGLTSVTIPNSVTSIGDEAFHNCSGLTSIEIPNSVTSIGDFAFYDCRGLTSITIGQDVPIADYWRICGTIDGKNVHNHPNLTQVEAPAWFFDVEENNWSYCPKYMTNIKVNAGMLTDNAFSVIKRNYKTLKKLDVSNVENTTLADEAFKDNYNLTELILPAGLTSVSYMVVAGCVSLKQIDIPASVEEIDNRAFEDCRSIETITFGGKQPSSKPGLRLATASTESQLRKIGNWAFYNAHELQHLEIPEGVTEIGDAAFYGCTYLQDLFLPKTVNRIGDNCFALCSHLERIDVGALTPPTIFARTFFDVSRKIPVYVPEDVILDYLNDPYWKEMNIQGTPTGIEEIGVLLSDVGTKKVLRNGQLYILRNCEIYSATGARVE